MLPGFWLQQKKKLFSELLGSFFRVACLLLEGLDPTLPDGVLLDDRVAERIERGPFAAHDRQASSVGLL
jgi:hypothetical protein